MCSHRERGSHTLHERCRQRRAENGQYLNDDLRSDQSGVAVIEPSMAGFPNPRDADVGSLPQTFAHQSLATYHAKTLLLGGVTVKRGCPLSARRDRTSLFRQFDRDPDMFRSRARILESTRCKFRQAHPAGEPTSATSLMNTEHPASSVAARRQRWRRASSDKKACESSSTVAVPQKSRLQWCPAVEKLVTNRTLPVSCRQDVRRLVAHSRGQALAHTALRSWHEMKITMSPPVDKEARNAR